MGSFISSLKTRKPKTKALTIRELLGIQDIQNGIVIRENHAAYKYVMILEIAPINFRLKSLNEQEFIIKAYEELLKILKCPFQTSLLSRKADASAHSKYMEQQMKDNTDPRLREHMNEYLSFFKENSSKSAVSRRFLLTIPYVVPTGMNIEKIEFSEVVDTLYEIKGRVKQSMLKCGNEVIDHDDPTYFGYDILYQLLNRISSETQSLPRHLAGFFLEVKE